MKPSCLEPSTSHILNLIFQEIPEIDLICCQESALIVEESIIVAHKIVTTETMDTETVNTETNEECLSTSSSSSDNQSK